jgi:proteasome lid subunit RPN8/RPN11
MVGMLTVPPQVRRQLAQVAREGYPNETCGVLVGQRSDRAAVVERMVPARNLNVERAAVSYELDPADFVRADLQARDDSLEIVGIWHSHPDHPAEPSETDRRAAWEGWSYLILSVTATGVDEWRSWRLEGERFVEETLKQEVQLT